MARKPATRRRKAAARTRKPAARLDEKALTKGQLRKLTALRKSVGDRIAERAFARWLASAKKEPRVAVDRNAEMIVGALEPLAKARKLRIRRGGYLVKRGWGREIVIRAAGD